MPPKQSTSSTPRGRPPGSKNKASTSSRPAAAEKPSVASMSAKARGKQRAEASDEAEPMEVDEQAEDVTQQDDDDDDDDEPEKTIPPELLTRILHEFFEKDGTKITRDANSAVAKYMDIFVKEAIARAAAERNGGFLEVCCSHAGTTCEEHAKC